MIAKKHMLAIENFQFMFDDRCFDNLKHLSWQSEMFFAYQMGCSDSPLCLMIARCFDNLKHLFWQSEMVFAYQMGCSDSPLCKQRVIMQNCNRSYLTPTSAALINIQSPIKGIKSLFKTSLMQIIMFLWGILIEV